MDISRKILFTIFISSILNLTIAGNVFALLTPKTIKITSSNNFLGKWNMQTIVTKSSCPYILVGSTTESNLEIKPSIQNKTNKIFLKILWKGGKWKKSTGIIKLLNNKEAVSERKTEIVTKDSNKWNVVLIDHYNLEEENIMHSESIVIQYKNGTPVGEYKTQSILTKSE